MTLPVLTEKEELNFLAANGFRDNLDIPLESALHNDCICQRAEDTTQLFICVLLEDILRVGIKKLPVPTYK